MSPYHYEIFMRLTDKEGNRHKMHNIIRIKQKVKYILLAFTMENQYKDRMITEFLNCESNLLITEHGYKLYEIRDSRLNVRLSKPRFKRLKDVRLFSLKNHGIRGTFDLNKDRKKKIFTVSNKNADGKGNRLIQLGFHFTSGGSENQIPAGKYIHLLVEAKIPRHLLNRQNYVFIQDFVQHRGKGKKQWQREKLYFSSPHWRTYRVSRELSENSSQFMLGIRFNPNSPEDKLVIKNIRAYVSNTPL
ncbi:MAG: hypothetical protein GY940_38870 [bacterium]|nr:hypothetical protein [bacterium]